MEKSLTSLLWRIWWGRGYIEPRPWGEFYILVLFSFSVIALELIGGILSNVLDKVVNLPASIVAGHLLRALGQPVEGGEALDIKLGRDVVGGGVHLHNLNILIRHLLAQLFKHWR